MNPEPVLHPRHNRSAALACLAGLAVCAAAVLAIATVSAAQAAPAHSSATDAFSTHLHLQSETVTTTHSLAGSLGANGWFVSPVTVTLTTEGDASATLYQLDGGNWTAYLTPFVIGTDGVHALAYYSLDSVGGAEPTHTVPVWIDTAAPATSVSVLPDYQATPSFPVMWGGGDGGGSGIAGYDVQYRDSALGVWRGWLTNTLTTSANFTVGQRGHVYYFRARARDVAGNLESFAGGLGDAFTFIDSVTNGGLESGSFSGWTVTGEMSKSIAFAPPVGGMGQWSALLGSPEYGSSITPTRELHVPTNTVASLSQVIIIPSLADLPAPAMRLWYRVNTYDVVWGCSEPDKLYDSFDVTIRNAAGEVLAMPVRDGNYDCTAWNAYMDVHGIPPLSVVSAQRAIDLTPYAGGSVIIEMHNANRQDWNYNTWTYVDAIQVVNQPVRMYRVYLPNVMDNEPVRRSAGDSLQPAASGGTRR